jgi:hypothetical protein
MKFIKYLLFASSLSISFCSAQTVLNAETLRHEVLKIRNKWNGEASIDFSITKNTNNIFKIVTDIGIGYNDGKNLWMIKSNINFNKTAGEAFENSGTQHFRYNRKLGEKTKLEVFAQGQYDQISEIKFRGLAGLGPRFKLSKNRKKSEDEKHRIYLGLLIMYEYEKSKETDGIIIQKDVRSSSYFSFTLLINDGIKVISTTYFQPKIDLLKDYRISSEFILKIKFPSKDSIKLEPHETALYDVIVSKSNHFWESL